MTMPDKEHIAKVVLTKLAEAITILGGDVTKADIAVVIVDGFEPETAIEISNVSLCRLDTIIEAYLHQIKKQHLVFHMKELFEESQAAGPPLSEADREKLYQAFNLKF